MASKNRLESEFTSPEESPGFLLWQVSNQWQRHIRMALKELDLTHVQFVLLASIVWLEDHARDVNQAVLSKHASIDKMMVSDVIRTLEKKQFILRKVMPSDGRAFLIHPTPVGIKLIKKAIRAVEKADDEFFSRSQLSRKSIVDCFKGLYESSESEI